MNRFLEFNNTELEILEEALCEYNFCTKRMIEEIRAEKHRRESEMASINDCAVILEIIQGINKGL